MNLPAPLVPWAAELDPFPREMAVPLGALARPLDALIGPLRDRRRRGADGEPDGYSDIARRGPYERLLLSEWLLATEEPDEWTRRAVAGEHAFLHLSRREPVADRLAAVLFDAGPSQWGGARLAHLAALIVLYRRAKAAGARFAWGVLQHPPPAPEAPLWDDVTEAGVLRLLRAAAPREATAGDLAAWRERLGGAVPKDARTPDLWVVGAGRLRRVLLAAAGARASLLTVEEPHDADTNADDEGSAPYLIANAVFGPDAAAPRAVATDVRLPLPAPDVRVRLLRDPFAAKRHAPAATSPRDERPESPRDAPVSDLLFSLHGSKLFARGAARGGTTLLVYPIGNGPAANVSAPPKQYRSQFGTPFFAAGREGKTTFLVSLASDGTAVRVETIGKGGGSHWAGSYRLTAPVKVAAEKGGGTTATARLRPVVPLYKAGGHTPAELVTVLPDGRLVRLCLDQDTGATGQGGVGLVVGLRCLALYRATDPVNDRKGVALILHVGRSCKSFLLRDGADGTGRSMAPMGPSGEAESGDDPVVLCDEIEKGGPVAVLPAPDAETGTLLLPAGRAPLRIPTGARLVGVERRDLDEKADHAWLWLLSEDRRSVVTVRSSHPETAASSFTAPERITRAVKSPYSRLIAYATESGAVGVWSPDHGDHVYRRHFALPLPGGAA